jgi:hypothetical protein
LRSSSCRSAGPRAPRRAMRQPGGLPGHLPPRRSWQPGRPVHRRFFDPRSIASCCSTSAAAARSTPRGSHRGEHDRAPGRGHRGPARPSGLERRCSSAAPGVPRWRSPTPRAPGRSRRDGAARGVPGQPRRGRLVSRRTSGTRAAGMAGPGRRRGRGLLRHYHGSSAETTRRPRSAGSPTRMRSCAWTRESRCGGGAQDPGGVLARARIQLHYLAHDVS